MISWLLLTWNSANSIRTALESAKDLVDEIVVVDSNSTDETLDILDEYDAKVYTKALEKSWSELRNFGISKASYEWILVLDSDEYLTKETLLMIPKLVESDEVDAFIFRRLNYLDGVLQEAKDYHYRLFKRHCRYAGRIHEQLVGFKKSKVIEDAIVMHKKTWKKQKEQDERYLEFTKERKK